MIGTRRALGLHATLAVLLPAFAALCWWQVDRALSGNELSWAYVFEWPAFGLYAVYMWWRLLHEPEDPPAPATGPAELVDHEPVDDELAAYNRYLADLERSGRRKTW